MRTQTRGSKLQPVVVVLVAAFLLAAWPAVAEPVAAGVEETGGEVVADLAAREAVAEALAAQGLSSEEIEDRLGRLTDEDIRYFADHEEQVRAAGTNVEPKYIYIAAAVIIFLLLI